MTPLAPSHGLGTTQQHALEWLRRAIVAGEIRPGDRVHQDDIARRIGVSVAPVREALRVLEQEGQVTYLPRRGYIVTELRIEDLEEIYQLRQVLEEMAVREALPKLDDEAIERLVLAARECADAAGAADVTGEIVANRRFHFAILDACERPHLLRLIALLWDSTDAYRAIYYNAPAERTAAIEAHDSIIDAIQACDADRLVRTLDDHRERALEVLRAILGEGPPEMRGTPPPS